SFYYSNTTPTSETYTLSLHDALPIFPFNRAGQLPEHSREQMRAFLATARRVAPEMKVLPWVGGLRAGWRRQRPGTVDLADLGQRSEEHTSELQSRGHLVCRLLLEKKK